MSLTLNSGYLTVNSCSFYVNKISSVENLQAFFYSGASYSFSEGLTFNGNVPTWYSTEASGNFYVYDAGYFPASEAADFYASYVSNPSGSGEEQDWTKGTSLHFMTSNTITDLINPWDPPVLCVVYPYESGSEYRVYDAGDGFSLTGVTYTNGDKYGLFREVDGTIKAKYYRNGTWNVMHTFSTTSTDALWIASRGFYFSHLNDPYVSPNFVLNAPVSITFDQSMFNFRGYSSGWWGPSAIGTGDYYGGKTFQFLGASADGSVQTTIITDGFTIGSNNIGIAFDLSNSKIFSAGDPAFDYFIYVEGANLHYKTSDQIDGYVDSGVTASVGDYMRMIRINSTIYGQYNRDGTWKNFHQFPGLTSSPLYIYGGGYDITQYEYIVDPIGMNLTSSIRVLIDVGGNTASVPSKTPISNPDVNGNYWNKFVGTGVYSGTGPVVNGFYSGLSLGNIFDTDNISIGATVTLTTTPNTTFVVVSNTPGLDGNGTTASVGDYISSATRDSMFMHSSSSPGQIQFTGLDSTRTYRFKFWGSRIVGSLDNRYLEMKKSTDSWTSSLNYNASENVNYDNAIEFGGVSGVSEIAFDMRSLTGSTFGYIGVIDILVT